MDWILRIAVAIPLLPLAAAGVIAVLPRRSVRWAIGLAVVSMVGALGLSVAAFAGTWGAHGTAGSHVLNLDWFQLGTEAVRLGVLLDPLALVMLLMVSTVGLLIFVFSIGYMAGDENVTRFFGFLALFAAGMLGLVMANSLILLFACWEVMGLASYLLIGFWYARPAAAAAAKKAFIVTRIGDLGLFLGILWWYTESGTLLFYDGGQGCLEAAAVGKLTATTVTGTLSAATGIALLLLVGAVGKSGQVPLHVWLPDAMEGPTPVSALIHAATMVAGGVFLMARVFPLMTGNGEMTPASGESPALRAVTVVGAVTAVFAACIAVAQTDIKRILAYSTVSQLGYMFLGLGTGGVAVGVFHLITHACFKALLFLGAGSVIHGCHHQQDIRRLGGLRRAMPVTFAVYATGMMALSGVPLVFSGFWSKDEILHAAWAWAPGRWPLVLGLVGAGLTAFYMTRQMAEVFFGRYRGGSADPVHESPRVMTLPLVVLAVLTVLLAGVGTPAWPAFEAYLSGHTAAWNPGRLKEALPMMVLSTGVVAVGLGLGWWIYGRQCRERVEAPDPVQAFVPRVFGILERRLLVDEVYAATVGRAHAALAALSAVVDRWVIGGLVLGAGWLMKGLAAVMGWLDDLFVNAGFDAGCRSVRLGGRGLSRLQGGKVQGYLAAVGLGMVILAVAMIWGMRAG